MHREQLANGVSIDVVYLVRNIFNGEIVDMFYRASSLTTDVLSLILEDSIVELLLGLTSVQFAASSKNVALRDSIAQYCHDEVLARIAVIDALVLIKFGRSQAFTVLRSDRRYSEYNLQKCRKCAIAYGRFNVLRWLLWQKQPLYSLNDNLSAVPSSYVISLDEADEIRVYAARHGQIAMMKWLREICEARPGRCDENVLNRKWHLRSESPPGWVWYSGAREIAAHCGQVELLEYLYQIDISDEAIHDTETKWGYRVWIAAARGGHLNVLNWLIGRVPCQTQSAMCEAAAENNHLEALQWLRSEKSFTKASVQIPSYLPANTKAPWHWTESTFAACVSHQNFHILKWCYNNGLRPAPEKFKRCFFCRPKMYRWLIARGYRATVGDRNDLHNDLDDSDSD
jgi:hypothetical protein